LPIRLGGFLFRALMLTNSFRWHCHRVSTASQALDGLRQSLIGFDIRGRGNKIGKAACRCGGS
jgi:hypothetical protein